MSVPLQVFSDQVDLHQQVTAFFYIFASLGVFLGVIAVALIDAGFVHRKNLMDTIVQKILSAFIASGSFMLVGYAVWNYQYYQAFAVPNGFSQALSDWWMAGANLSKFAQNIDPAGVPEADTFQVFSVFFFCFSGLTAALIHGAGLERIKPGASFITAAFVGGVMVPALSYLTYGSVSPLTNAGLHDFVGAYCLYMLVGVWSLVLAWRLGPRLSIPAGPHNPLLAAGGFFALLLAIPMFVIGCGFLTPGQGYFGPTMTTSGLGIVFANVFMSFAGGALSGGWIAYRKRKPLYILSGPVAGYLACTALFDLVLPWQALVISLCGPFILIGGEALLRKLKIDDPKVTPLALGPSVFSVLMAGWVGAGVPQGGFPGIADGTYAFQHAHVSFATQLEGVLIVVAISAFAALILSLIIEKTVGLRVSAQAEQRGLDDVYWNMQPQAANAAAKPQATAA
ncbi:ammonium transporter [Pseudomonas typographi]|uniref:Ammonium transporter n=1 Tax=Pseudomonas typographi TaxID=2715964 RepID=A0ABR7Z512_9PSED|nr:ammonium transporter [Pseudomonas typographi]MBD1586940.1 ammonium transporter [Pseudomonas typographi]MBD1600601.1 ammonium transporter [Pseudomonas typographi]